MRALFEAPLFDLPRERETIAASKSPTGGVLQIASVRVCSRFHEAGGLENVND